MMKTLRLSLLVILAIGSTSLAYGTTDTVGDNSAAERGPGAYDAKPSQQGAPSNKPRRAPVIYDKSYRYGRPTTGTIPAKRPSNNGQSIGSPNSAGLYHASAEKSVVDAKPGFIQKESISNALPVRPATVSRPGASLNDVRHRGPNPAIIAGSPSPKTPAAGAINGTRVHRNP